jgi:hypothetical protein
VTRLHHVNVVVPPGRTEDVVGFYELLGLQRVPKPEQGVAKEGAWFDLPDGRTQVHVSERDGSPHPDQHLALAVPDLPDLVARLVAEGHPWSPKPDVLGSARGMTRDPAGNAVELVEALGPFA